jgi:hypothetical protein
MSSTTATPVSVSLDKPKRKLGRKSEAFKSSQFLLSLIANVSTFSHAVQLERELSLHSRLDGLSERVERLEREMFELSNQLNEKSDDLTDVEKKFLDLYGRGRNGDLEISVVDGRVFARVDQDDEVYTFVRLRGDGESFQLFTTDLGFRMEFPTQELGDFCVGTDQRPSISEEEFESIDLENFVEQSNWFATRAVRVSQFRADGSKAPTSPLWLNASEKLS